VVLRDHKGGMIMGDVAVHVRIMPESTDVDMNAVLEKVKEILGDKLKNAEIKPFVFGLKVVEAIFVVPDEEGVLDQEVEKLSKINGIQNVEVLEVSLV